MLARIPSPWQVPVFLLLVLAALFSGILALWLNPRSRFAYAEISRQLDNGKSQQATVRVPEAGANALADPLPGLGEGRSSNVAGARLPAGPSHLSVPMGASSVSASIPKCRTGVKVTETGPYLPEQLGL